MSKRYIWNGAGNLVRHWQDGGDIHDEEIEPGAMFEPTEAELRAFGDLMSPSSAGGSAGGSEGEQGELEALFGPRAAGSLADGGYGSLDDLVDAYQAHEDVDAFTAAMVDIKGIGKATAADIVEKVQAALE